MQLPIKLATHNKTISLVPASYKMVDFKIYHTKSVLLKLLLPLKNLSFIEILEGWGKEQYK